MIFKNLGVECMIVLIQNGLYQKRKGESEIETVGELPASTL